MHSIEKLSQASRMLAEASTLEDLQQIRGIAQMASEYAKAAKLGLEAQNTAAEIKLRAERKAGELLSELKRDTPQTANKNGNNQVITNVGNDPSPYKQALEDSDTSYQDANRWQKVAAVPDFVFEEFIEETKAAGEELTTSRAVRLAIEPYDGDEWYTPLEYIQAAYNVLGVIDLDPASSLKANEAVKAHHIYTKEDNGLNHDWLGNVWLNPPFSDPKPFITKCLDEFVAGNVIEAIILVNNGTETGWGQSLLLNFPVCFADTRISFWRATPDKPEKGNRYAQMIFYLGENAAAFYDEFSQFGAMLEPRREL